MTKARTNADNASADIQGVTAGTGLSGGGTSGTVTLTNDMATTIDAKGDLVVGTGADTYSRLAVSDNGSTLVADSSASTGLRWQGNYAAGKNKIINGDFGIWQRGTAAVIPIVDTRTYLADRWFAQLGSAGAGRFSIEQASDVPAAANAGSFSLKAVVTTTDASTAAGEQYWIGQIIEGNNFASFQFGTASAQTITISFWVKSNITGTFGFAIRNSAADRSYVSTYTISAANTWEKKTITIAGDTSGTWLKDSGIGARIEWTLNAGTDFQTGSPNSWTASNDMTTSAQTNWLATLSNSFQITAVQVEAGAVATAFSTATGTLAGELAACQRYYYRLTAAASYPGMPFGFGTAATTTLATPYVQFPVQMRVLPTSVDYSALDVSDVANAGINVTSTNISTNFGGVLGAVMDANVASGLTVYRPYVLKARNSTSYLGFSAEL